MSTRSPEIAATAAATEPPANFDRVARIYRGAEYLALGPFLRLTRELHLSRISGAKQALVLGDGDGRFTAELLARAPNVHVRAVDTSAGMLRVLRQRCERRGTGSRLSVEQASALEAIADRGTDLVVSHFFLDCLTQSEVDRLALRIAAQVSPGCLWVVSDFGLPRNPVAKPLAAAYIRGLYLAFRVLTGLHTQALPDPQASLGAAGFRLLARGEHLGGFLYSELWQLGPKEEYKRDSEDARSATSPVAQTSTCR